MEVFTDEELEALNSLADREFWEELAETGFATPRARLMHSAAKKISDELSQRGL